MEGGEGREEGGVERDGKDRKNILPIELQKVFKVFALYRLRRDGKIFFITKKYLRLSVRAYFKIVNRNNKGLYLLLW